MSICPHCGATLSTYNSPHVCSPALRQQPMTVTVGQSDPVQLRIAAALERIASALEATRPA